MPYYLLGLGSNIRPNEHLRLAEQQLQDIGRVVSASPILNTAPVGDTFHYEFCNQLLVLHTEMPPTMLKHKLQVIETNLGREPKNPSRKTKDRTIDLDILARAADAETCRQHPVEESYYQKVMSLWSNKVKEESGDHTVNV